MRFEKAILVNPPNPPGYVSNKDSMGGFGQLFPPGAPPFPPLDLPYLAAYLLREGFEVEAIEAGALGLSTAQVCETVKTISHGKDSLMVVVRTSLPTIDWDLSVCAEIRRTTPNVVIGVYGGAVPALSFRIQRDATIDFAVLGEPDEPVAELMRGDPADQVRGLLTRDPGGWTSSGERKAQRDLDSLPFPRWDLLPYERYVIPKSSTTGKLRFLPMLTSRGCPFGCSYCPYPVGQGLKWRYRSPRNVVDEMERLVRDFGVEYTIFRDPMFSLNQERVVEISEEIVRRGLRIRWACETRVDCLEESTIASMAKAGCAGINFGVESSDPEIQKGVDRKPILVDEFVRKVGICRKHNIRTFAFFIVGLPGDTVETILSTMKFALRIRASWVQFTVATPFIGTKLHQWATGHGFIPADRYQIISSHEGSTGNENLSAAQVHSLHRFAQILQNNLINRRGLLKDESRTGILYRAARRAADHVCWAAAGACLAAASLYFGRESWRVRGERLPAVPLADREGS